ncbi:MAG: hypothetical protein R3F37_18095 [Candidatus Competibacteraceae bacterium]
MLSGMTLPKLQQDCSIFPLKSPVDNSERVAPSGFFTPCRCEKGRVAMTGYTGERCFLLVASTVFSLPIDDVGIGQATAPCRWLSDFFTIRFDRANLPFLRFKLHFLSLIKY